MILHLVSDEKIINRTISLYEKVFPGENYFVVFTKYNFNYVTQKENVIPYLEYSKVASKIKPTAIIMHFMTNRKIRFVKKYCPKDIPLYWVMWGKDLYDRLLEPKGAPLLSANNSFYKTNSLKKFFTLLIKIPNDKIRIRRRLKFIKERVKYLVTSTIENDYDMLMSYYPELKNIPLREMSYYPIDDIIGDEMRDAWVNDDKIQVGHTGTFSVNHEYALDLLATATKDRDIILPMSYSGTKEYKNAVIKKGKELFGNKVTPILNFMPLSQYNELMRSCSVAIYPSWRQEAVGNVLVSLYLGTKVFLSKFNPMLEWAKKHGFVVYELEKITKEDIEKPLEEEARKNNRKIILSDFSSEKLYDMMKNSFVDR